MLASAIFLSWHQDRFGFSKSFLAYLWSAVHFLFEVCLQTRPTWIWNLQYRPYCFRNLVPMVQKFGNWRFASEWLPIIGYCGGRACFSGELKFLPNIIQSKLILSRPPDPCNRSAKGTCGGVMSQRGKMAQDNMKTQLGELSSTKTRLPQDITSK